MEATQAQKRRLPDVSGEDVVTFSAEVPSPELEAFLPVELGAEDGGVMKQFTVEFTAKVKFPPVNGAYGNYTPSKFAQQYVQEENVG